MEYKELRKVYFQNDEEYNNEYAARYNSRNAFHLDFLIGNNPAFYEVNMEVQKLMLHILRTDKEVLKLEKVLPGAALDQYRKKCLIDEVLVTNGIEGVRSTRKEINEAIEEVKNKSINKDKKKRFVGMVRRYLTLQEKDTIPLETCQDIRNLYDEVVLDEVIAENPKNAPDGAVFRKEQATITSSTDKELHRGFYPESKIIIGIEKALQFLNNQSIESLYRICLFHYLMEYVHPFYDGNGRLGRFIVSYMLSKELEPLMAYRLSETIMENIKEYYDAFNTCNDFRSKGDITPFLIMMLKMIDRAEVQLKETLQNKSISWKRYDGVIPMLPYADEKRMSTVYSLFIQAALFSDEGISRQELCEIVRVSSPTIARLVEKAKESGIVIEDRMGRSYFYKADLEGIEKILSEKKA